MHAVVNRLRLSRPLERGVRFRFEQELGAAARNEPGFSALHLVEVSPTELVVLVLFETRAALDDISGRVIGPWFVEHLRPYLAEPLERVVGEVVASVLHR